MPLDTGSRTHSIERNSYDIFIDPSYAPTNRNGKYEIMIWVAHQLPNTPLSDHYDAKGVAIPWAQNVNLGGKAWDVYLFQYVMLHL
jgi:hypothetical protein